MIHTLAVLTDEVENRLVEAIIGLLVARVPACGWLVAPHSAKVPKCQAQSHQKDARKTQTKGESRCRHKQRQQQPRTTVRNERRSLELEPGSSPSAADSPPSGRRERHSRRTPFCRVPTPAPDSID